jgi:hypothetical protein
MNVSLTGASDDCMMFDGFMGDCNAGKFGSCTVAMTASTHVYNVTYTYTEGSPSTCTQ